MVIFAVSPNYLEALYEEAKSYSFKLQGYGSLVSAQTGLLKTNVSEILGFLIVCDDMLQPDELAKFLYSCNMICAYSSKKVIFACKNYRKLPSILNAATISNLRVSYLPNFDVLTDVVINKNLFGAILLDHYAPYKLIPEEEESIKMKNSKMMFQPLFSEYVLRCLKPIDKLNSYDATLSNDGVYQLYRAEKSDLAFFRLCMIRRLFDLDIDDEQLANIVNSKDEEESYCVYRAIASKI